MLKYLGLVFTIQPLTYGRLLLCFAHLSSSKCIEMPIIDPKSIVNEQDFGLIYNVIL